MEQDNTVYIGDDAIKRRDVLSLKHPIEHGIIVDFDGMEQLWNYVFSDQSGVISKGATVLMTQPLGNPKVNREKMVEIMFEKSGVERFYCALPEQLALYASGRVTGVVLTSGDAKG